MAQAEQYDLVVIGGGINGTGIALDATLRGLRVLLLESNNWCSGTSATSSMLAHGGLRYLEYFELGLVHEALQDREWMFQHATHLVHPLRFLYPLYPEVANRRTVGVGLSLYDLLSHGKSVPSKSRMTAEALLELEPGLNPEHLKGCATYYDGQWYSVERHVVEMLIDGIEHGLVARNGARVTSIQTEQREGLDGRAHTVVTGVRYVQNDETVEVRARMVVNAAGPWVDQVLSGSVVTPAPLIRGTKGAHILTPAFTKEAFILKEKEGRTFFILPWRGVTVVGTTDTDWAGDPRDAHATEEDIAYLQAIAKQYFPEAPVEEVLHHYAGVRPLVHQTGLKEGAVTRRHVLYHHDRHEGIHGLLSIQGGKLTTYRTLSEEVASQVCLELGRKDLAKLRPTRQRNLPGTPYVDWPHFLDSATKLLQAESGWSTEKAEAFVHTYGARWRVAFEAYQSGVRGSITTHGFWPAVDLDLPEPLRGRPLPKRLKLRTIAER